ncbi:MAG: gamma carbonic anhydrase family protein [Spirochaetes bacterium]|nr:gamma carbonic anhydrase family protein [Spirochaetota bacterium]
MTGSLYKFKNLFPEIHDTCFIADGARLIGDVIVEEMSSIWFNAVLRADLASIKIGKRTSVQDNAVIHVDHDLPCVIGDDVVAAHSTVLHSCTVGNGCLIGMGAVLLTRVEVGEGSIIAAGSVVKEGTVVPPNSLYAGSPARFVKKVGEEVRRLIIEGAGVYTSLIEDYRKEV